MAEPRHTPPFDDIERALQHLAGQLDWPSEPNLRPSVRERLAALPERRSFLARLRPATPYARVGWATATLVVLVTLVLTVSDSTRSTVADRLGLAGVSISTDSTATLTPGRNLSIGERTTLDDAIRRSGGTLILPPETVLDQPDDVYVLDQDGVMQVSYVYLPGPDLTEIEESGVGLLISQFDGNTNDSFIQKQLAPGTTIEFVEVNHQSAFWLTGEPHIFFYESPDGQIREETIRLAANVLLWELDGKTLRIETTLDRDTA
ncbi:MAG: hypothetical protein M3439_01555, partial [Chloroflexota bacterium]|nr:hypothetical protein [Chloroflexota bacterium]